ncbi:MAG: hypothetical protein IJ681_10590 [Bacteroidales bacterium]|nr:hypothetical protein [Bacteroidales bacterium]
MRYKLKYYDRLEFSLVADKDFGEPLFIKGKTYGYDHYNIALTLNGTGKYLKQITIGDYRLNIGEGLAMKQNFSFGYFSPTFGAKQSAKEIVPMRSSRNITTTKELPPSSMQVRWIFLHLLPILRLITTVKPYNKRVTTEHRRK